MKTKPVDTPFAGSWEAQRVPFFKPSGNPLYVEQDKLHAMRILYPHCYQSPEAAEKAYAEVSELVKDPNFRILLS